MKPLIVIFLVLFVLVVESQDALVPSEKNTLIALKALGGSTAEWDESTDPCTAPLWKGVICTIEGPDLHVRALLLGFSSLSGAIPNAISGLTELQSLLIQDNQITALPANIGSLRKLEIIRATNNAITELPATIKDCNLLRSIDLGNNQISSLRPDAFAVGQVIEKIILKDNRIAGKLPDISFLNELTEFSVENNLMEDVLPVSWAEPKLSKLAFLNLANNKFSGTVPEEWVGKKFTRLFLQKNQLSCEFPNFLVDATYEFLLTENKFMCPLPLAIAGSGLADCTGAKVNGVYEPAQVIKDKTTEISFTVEGNFQDGCGVKVYFLHEDQVLISPELPKWDAGTSRMTVVLPAALETKRVYRMEMRSKLQKVIANGPPLSLQRECPAPGGEICNKDGNCNPNTGECTCFAGRFGDGCESSCDRTCNGRGKCFVLGSTAQCDCNPGWFGLDCDVEACTKECINGICDRATSECACDTGWIGEFCEKRPPCTATDCVHGTCDFLYGVAEPVCKCTEGWQGKKCDTEQEADTPAWWILLWVFLAIAIIILIVLLIVCCIKCRFTPDDSNNA